MDIKQLCIKKIPEIRYEKNGNGEKNLENHRAKLLINDGNSSREGTSFF
jgi:hypothetical protein